MHETLHLRLTGIAPLLMHSGQLADPLNPHSVALQRVTSKRLKTTADHDRIAQIEWRGGLWLSAGRPCVPGEAIEAALVAGGRARRVGSLVRAACVVRDSPPLDYDGPTDLDELFADRRFVDRRVVRIGARKTVRTRPRFDAWSLAVAIAYAPSAIDGVTLMEIAQMAGQMIGIGDFRPRFGQFRVDLSG